MVGKISLFHIDLNLLTTLSLLLQTRSVSATARRLGTSQPTASRSLARLREVFDDPLLIRTNKGMELTSRAQGLATPLEEWLANTSALFTTKELDPATIERRFRIATTDYGVTAVLSPALQRLNELAPGITLDIVTFSDAMFAKLTSGEIDLIISGLAPDHRATYSRKLFTETQLCMVRADHPLADIVDDRLSLDQYLDWPHISIQVGESPIDPINNWLGDHAPRRRILAKTPYFQAALTMLGTSDAIITLPSRGINKYVDRNQLRLLAPPDIFPIFDYWILWHERSRRDPATMWILDLIEMCCRLPSE